MISSEVQPFGLADSQTEEERPSSVLRWLCSFCQRAQIESLFGLQRRAALRVMAPLVSASRNGSWQVNRQGLIQWLEGFEQEVTEEQQRHHLVLQALHDVEAENGSLREELRRQGRPDPPSWTLKQEVFARNISSLPTEIVITQGMVFVRFPMEDLAYSARLLHELSLAMLNDWTTFCRLAGSASHNTAANTIDRLLEESGTANAVGNRQRRAKSIRQLVNAAVLTSWTGRPRRDCWDYKPFLLPSLRSRYKRSARLALATAVLSACPQRCDLRRKSAMG
jgi:hypothetical protein